MGSSELSVKPPVYLEKYLGCALFGEFTRVIFDAEKEDFLPSSCFHCAPKGELGY
jgi:hypothetical protein